MNKCRLCHEEKKLEESHIVPKFLGKWLRKNSATGYLRSNEAPNMRRQDLFKIHLLCKACEDLISDDESYFANTIFHPYMNRPEASYHFAYDERLIRFCAGLSWRVLVYLTEHLNDEDNIEIQKYKLKLENFLLKKIPNLDQYEQHIIPLELNSQSPLNIKHSNVNSYFFRSVDIDLLDLKDERIIYIKIPNFIIIANINYKYISKMRASRVALKKGIIAPKNYYLPIEMYNYLDDRLTFIKENINDEISDVQTQKILEDIKKDPDRLMKSDTLKAIKADHYSSLSKPSK
ncbi:hypothetical protein ACSJMR_13620 [Acinetobacter pecorum]|uniref:hypothetical protein n=1 Tax=Acinetobacter pecorum TaxID=2762215 RepID=UPI003EE5BD39